MKLLVESELRSILQAYRVCDPPEALVSKTKHRMREEMALQTIAPACQYGWAMALIGLALVLSLNLFYILTVGTILRMVLSPQFAGILKNLTVAFSMAEGCLLAGAIMLFYFKQVQNSLVRTHVRYTIH
ncbi:MAG: hypothetical protein Q8O92_00190 [Candidatus Latescibacter sp.]|nr:hypothetical protein [Candidatus Latescibacter sp.]